MSDLYTLSRLVLSGFSTESGILVPVTPQYASRNPRTSKPHLKLSRIDLTFSWNVEDEHDPFAEHCPLPYMALLNNVVHRFVAFQFVRFVSAR